VDPTITTKVIEFNDLDALERALEPGDEHVAVQHVAVQVGVELAVVRGRHRQRIPGQRAAHRSGVAQIDAGTQDPVGDLPAHAIRADRDATRDRLADGEEVGIEAMSAHIAARAGALGLGLVDDEQRAGAARDLAERVVVTRLWEDDAEAIQCAVNALMTDGTYQEILHKWASARARPHSPSSTPDLMDVLAPNLESRRGPSTLVKVVPVRHPGRWIAVTLLVVVLAMFAHMLVTNQAFQWSFMIDNMFQPPVLEGVRTTLLLTVLAMLLGVALGIVLAVMRLSPNPILRGTSWTYIWFFRSVPRLRRPARVGPVRGGVHGRDRAGRDPVRGSGPGRGAVRAWHDARHGPAPDRAAAGDALGGGSCRGWPADFTASG
jgi:hypothetical protein